MNFDFDNVDGYLAKAISPEAKAKLDKLNECVGTSVLTQKERLFIDSVKERIIAGRKLTEKQAAWLAAILDKCRKQRAEALAVAPSRHA